MVEKKDRILLVIGIMAGAFIALFDDLFEYLLTLIIPPEANLIPLTKTAAGLLAIACGLVLLLPFVKRKEKHKENHSSESQLTTESNNSKNKFRKFLESERNNMFILLGAGAALTISTTSIEFSWKFGSGLVASGLFIFAIFRRAKSNYGVQTQIDKLRSDIDELKRKSGNSNDSKLDDQ
ncbi:hypothetical protein [Candidatus Nitrosotenuis cloacae]|uniref:hypothetical protein n=1 Tax=Candidatus Nitrosotenuis cloacae TaxID=1603555 RepID=UPI0011DCA59F|nr:hypothetical protein [Candidatus Nitrosotenuis cloacae]